jgi:heme-binding NEAT domain protein
MKRLKWVIGALLVGLTFFGVSSTEAAHAKALNFKALTYGTTKTSIASAYFVHPASVTVKHQQYVVTMHIRTAKKLTAFPVKVLQVNGHAPQRVRRVRDKAGNSNLYYSFTTKSLAKVVNAKLAINVPKVYKATHLISFKFSQSQLPSLKTTRHASVATKSAQPLASSSSKAVTQADQASSQSIKTISNGTPTRYANSASAISQKSQSSTQTAVTSTKSTQSQSGKQPASQSQKTSSIKVASADHADQSAPQLNWWFLIGGIAVIVVVVVGGGLVVAGQHGRGR